MVARIALGLEDRGDVLCVRHLPDSGTGFGRIGGEGGAQATVATTVNRSFVFVCIWTLFLCLSADCYFDLRVGPATVITEIAGVFAGTVVNHDL